MKERHESNFKFSYESITQESQENNENLEISQKFVADLGVGDSDAMMFVNGFLTDPEREAYDSINEAMMEQTPF